MAGGRALLHRHPTVWPRIRIHDLRHTAATLLLIRGVHPKIVQEMLGHSPVALTLDTYSHATPALHAEVAGHMEELFRRSREPSTSRPGRAAHRAR